MVSEHYLLNVKRKPITVILNYMEDNENESCRNRRQLY